MRVDSEDRSSVALFLGFSQILSRTQALQTSLTFTHLSGFLSDPYKQSFVNNRIVADARPSERNKVAWLTYYRYFYRKANAAMHIDYRIYGDDWALESHTLEFAWYQNFGSW